MNLLKLLSHFFCLFFLNFFLWNVTSSMAQSHFQGQTHCQDDDDSEDSPTEVPIIFEKTTSFSLNLDKLNKDKAVQVGLEYDHLKAFEKSPTTSPEFQQYFSPEPQEKRDLTIVSAKAVTLIPKSDPREIMDLIENEEFMKAAFKKSQYQKMDGQNLSLERRVKIKLLGFEKRIKLDIAFAKHHKIDPVSELPAMVASILQNDKKFLAEAEALYGKPTAILELDIKGSWAIHKGKFILTIFPNKDREGETFVTTHQFYSVDKSYFRFMNSYFFRKFAEYGVHQIAPKLIQKVRHFGKGAK